MNSKALNEIRRRFTVDNTNLTCIRGCYVSEKREIISMFKLPPVSLPPLTRPDWTRRALRMQPKRHLCIPPGQAARPPRRQRRRRGRRPIRSHRCTS